MKHFINNGDMKAANTRDVFRLIQHHGSLTRKQIEKHSNLSWGAVSNITSRLLEMGYILEEKTENPGSGRIPTQLMVNGAEHFVLGVDINLIGIHAAMLNLRGDVLSEKLYTADFRNRDTLWEQLCTILDEWTKAWRGHHITGIGIGIQGKVDNRRGVSVDIPQCEGWHDVPLRQMIEEKYDIPVFIEHDPLCILHTVAEPDAYPNAALLRLDSGIGMAIMTEGCMYDVPGTCEIAHTIAVPDGIPCSCGKRGCLESYVSERGIAAQAGKDYRTVVKEARSGNKNALVYFSQMSTCLVSAVCNIVSLFDPQILYLCGEMTEDAELFLPALLTGLQKEGVSLKVKVLNEIHAAYGAALLATQHIEIRSNESINTD